MKKKVVTCVLPEGFERLAGYSYVVNNVIYINEAIQFPNTIAKGDDIISDIKVDGKTVNAYWAYGLISKAGMSPCHCLLSDNKITYGSGDIPKGYVALTVVASLK